MVRDLPTTLSKFLSLGMPLPDVVRAATATPARAIGRSGDLGTLARGAAGDAAVFTVDEGRFPYQDCDGHTLEGTRRWTPGSRCGPGASGGARPSLARPGPQRSRSRIRRPRTIR